jgi:phage shock protein PspC (stress-responsive transcriptional regulator)
MQDRFSGLRDPAEWTRDAPGRKLAGVCTSIAHRLGVSVTIVRASFLILALVHGFGILLYGVLWMLMPPAAGVPSALEEVFDAGRSFLQSHRRRPNGGEHEAPEPDSDERH